MIRRIYVDNYKCLVNFECKFQHLNLILGTNGSGKSTVFDALRDVRDFVNGKSPIGIFRDATLTRWQKRGLQTFEIEVEGNEGLYQYHLEVEHENGQDRQRVRTESVAYNGRTLYEAELDEVHLFRDDYSAGPTYPKDWTQSGLLFLGERHDNTLVTWLKKWFKEKLFCLQLDPMNMKPMAGATESDLDANALNFVGWYRHRISTDMSATIDLYNALKQMYDEFEGLKLERQGGDVQHLFATIGVQDEEKGKPINAKYSFADLSDGERCLVVLYTLLQLASDPEITLCLDEPDNYVALSEVQPWLMTLENRINENGSQALLISHHPEILDYLAEMSGLVFSRPSNAHTRVAAYAADASGLLPSEVATRGDL